MPSKCTSTVLGRHQWELVAFLEGLGLKIESDSQLNWTRAPACAQSIFPSQWHSILIFYMPFYSHIVRNRATFHGPSVTRAWSLKEPQFREAPSKFWVTFFFICFVFFVSRLSKDFIYDQTTCQMLEGGCKTNE